MSLLVGIFLGVLRMKIIKAVIAARDHRLETIEKQPKIGQKSPQVVKHVVKCEKWACSTLGAGKNKPIMYITKTRDFKRFCEEIKENRRFG